MSKYKVTGSIKTNIELLENAKKEALRLSNFVSDLDRWEKNGSNTEKNELVIDTVCGYPFRIELNQASAFALARATMEEVFVAVRKLETMIEQQAKARTPWCYPKDSPESKMSNFDGWGRPLSLDENGKIIFPKFDDEGSVIQKPDAIELALTSPKIL